MQKQLSIANMEIIELLDDDKARAIFLEKAIDSGNPEIMAEAIKAVAFAKGLEKLAEMSGKEFKDLCKVFEASPKTSEEEIRNLGQAVVQRFKVWLDVADFTSP